MVLRCFANQIRIFGRVFALILDDGIREKKASFFCSLIIFARCCVHVPWEFLHTRGLCFWEDAIFHTFCLPFLPPAVESERSGVYFVFCSSVVTNKEAFTDPAEVDADRSRDEVRGALNVQTGGGGGEGGGKVSLVTPSDDAGGPDIKGRHTLLPSVTTVNTPHGESQEDQVGGAVFSPTKKGASARSSRGHEPGRPLAAPPPFRTPSSLCLWGGGQTSDLSASHRSFTSTHGTADTGRCLRSRFE